MSETLDPKKQLMIGALYGELSPAEEAEFQRLLADDPELDAEYAELQGTRSLLGEWAGDQESPGFVFLGPESAPHARGTGWLARLRAGMSAPAWGFAAAATVLVVLMASGFRVDRMGNSLVLGFGTTTTAQPVIDNGFRANTGQEAAPALQATPGAVQTTPVAMPPDLLTRHELDTFAAGFMHAVESRLDDYTQRQNGELAYVMQNFYQDLRERQMQNYSLIMNQLEGTEFGLSKGSPTRSLPDSLLQTDPREDDR